MKSFLTLSLSFYLALSFAQKNPTILNPHAKDYIRTDRNQLYINTKVSELKNLYEENWSEGFVIRGRDTIRCRLYLPKKYITDDLYLYILAMPSNDSIIVYTAKEISAYKVGKITMKSHRSITARDTTYFFIRLVESGAVTLYEKPGLPSDPELVYYFHKKGDQNLQFIAPNKPTDFFIQERYNKDSPIVSRYSGPNENQFKIVFAEYLKDCQSIRNKILAKFYSINDIETIIREFNNCNK